MYNSVTLSHFTDPLRQPTRLLAILLLALWFTPATAFTKPLPNEAQQAIRQAYEKISVAASLKFVVGLLTVRAPEYRAYQKDGSRIDLIRERADLEQTLPAALWVREKTQILSFQQIDAKQVSCLIVDTTELILPEPGRKVTNRHKIVTKCRERWALRPEGWLQTSSTILEQNIQVTPWVENTVPPSKGNSDS